MQWGIFAKTFVRPTLAETLDAVVAHGFSCVQFNMACAGLESLPLQITPETCQLVRHEFARRELSMAGVSGTFNMIHPDREVRRDGLRRLVMLASAAPQMETSIVTLCTGTRDPKDMWRRHRDNDTPAAWRDLVELLKAALDNTSGVTLAFEPERANVVDSAFQARRLLDEVGSPRLKVVFDGANLIHDRDRASHRDVLQQAVELLAKDIALVHGKELYAEGEEGGALGAGRLDFGCCLELLRSAGYDGPLILHGMTEAAVTRSLTLLRNKLPLALRPAGGICCRSSNMTG